MTLQNVKDHLVRNGAVPALIAAVDKAIIEAKHLTPEDCEGPIRAECDNCGKVWNGGDVRDISDFWGRVSPGSIMPFGECPECNALCYYLPTDKPYR